MRGVWKHYQGILTGLVRDALVLLSFLPPVRWALAASYRVALRLLIARLRRRPYVEKVFLTGSLAAGDCVYGASDIDLIVLAGRGARKLAVKRDLRAFFTAAWRLFPLMGGLEERRGGVLFTDEIGCLPHACILRCRVKTGTATLVHDAGGGDLPAGQALTAEEVVAEVCQQVRTTAQKLLVGGTNLYFWKSKCRALLALLPGPCTFETLAEGLDAPLAAMARRLGRWPNRLLYFSRRWQDQEVAWQLLLKIVARAAAAHLDGLEEEAVSFRVTPAALVAPAGDLLPRGTAPHWFSLHPERFGGESILAVREHPYLLLSLEATDLPAVCSALRQLSEPPRQHATLLWMGDFVFELVRGRCEAVFSRWDRPFLFPDMLEGGDAVRYPRPFVEALLRERDHDLQHLRDAFYWRYRKDEAQADRSREQHEDAIRYFERRDRVLDGFAFIHLAACQSQRALTNFGSRGSVFEAAAAQHPAQRDLLLLLQDYSGAVRRQELRARAERFPPALLRAATSLFCDRLFGAPLKEDYGLHDRLALSLCVCTRNHADYLAELLDSVARNSHLPREVVVVDNASTDATAAVVERFRRRTPDLVVRYIVDGADTIGRVRNRAIRESRGDIVCFADDDCVLHPGWFRNIEEAFHLEATIGIVGGRTSHFEEASDSHIEHFHRVYLGARL